MSRGRGRGRGRGKGVGFSGNLEAIGLSQGESAPPPILQPPHLFPNLNRRPLPLHESEVSNYLVTIKQELKVYMTQSPFHLQIASSDSVPLQRYSDKSRLNGGTKCSRGSNGMGWAINWNFFPKELKPGVKLKKKIIKKRKKQNPPLSKMAIPRKKRKRGAKDIEGGVSDDGESGGVKAKKSRQSRRVTFEQDGEEGKLEKKLENLEKMEQLSGESEQSGGEETAEEVYEEEEEEEGTDYNLTYFDNGEEFDGGDDDALEDGPVY